MQTKLLPVKELRLDGDTQPRIEIDEDVTAEYAVAYKAGAKIPPVVVFFDGTDHWLADGFHRRFAAIKAKSGKIRCEVHKGTLEDARWYSYSANQTHGLRRSNADKAKAVKSALKHPKGVKMSDEAIAEYVGVSPPTVAKYRKEASATLRSLESDTREGRDGRTIDTTNIGKGKPEPDTEYEKCPTCGHDEFDEDGDCAKCREPSVAESDRAPEPAANTKKATKLLGQLVRELDALGIDWASRTMQEIKDALT